MNSRTTRYHTWCSIAAPVDMPVVSLLCMMPVRRLTMKPEESKSKRMTGICKTSSPRVRCSPSINDGDRHIEVGPPEGDQIVVASGLSPGKVVVIEGMDKLQQGMKVAARLAGASN